MARLSTDSNAQLDGIKEDIRELREMIKENRTALVGKDGVPGLVGNFASLCQRVSSIETILQNDIAHLSAKVDLMFTSQGVVTEQYNMSQAKLKAREDANVVTWSDVLKDWIKPIITGIVLSVLLYFLLK